MYLRTTFIAILSFLFLISSVAASEVDLTLSSSTMVGYGGETTSVDLIITNNQVMADTFTITVFPSEFGGVTTNLEKFSVRVNNASSEKVKLYFDMPLDVDEVSLKFNINVKSTSDESVSDVEELLLRIVRKTDVYIDDINRGKFKYNSEETVNIEVRIRNVGLETSGKYYLETTVEKYGIIVKKYNNIIESILPKSFEIVKNGYEIGKYDEPGIYNVQTVLEDANGQIISSTTEKFNVTAAYELPSEYTTKDTTYNFLFITTTVTVKNEGNINTPSFYITESAPGFGKLLFDPEIEPTEVSKSDGRVVYSWLIPTLEPGKEITIKYSYALWRIWLTLFIIAGGTYAAIKLLYTPKIIKRHKHRGPITKEKEVLVSLDVRNKSRHEVKDVQVRDVVPSIAKVVEKFDTLKPRMRTTSVGTEMRWKIDSLKPGEERVLTYRIKPVVEITGSLDLPKAHARYIDRKKVKRIIASKSVLIKG